ncbi:MAG: helix-hairpin-helix domain-containing protein [Bacteroidaceae bacterium]|nr:helix-hairpin-helix domain-containing protein [Bacteroidaceae bacterium]
MKRFLLVFLSCVCISHARGQSWMTWEAFVAEIHDDEWAEAQGWTEHMEELEALHQQPINVNTASMQQLCALPFIDEAQADDILAYILLNDGMRSLSELSGIASIDRTTRRYLSLFLTAEPAPNGRRDSLSLKRLWQRGRHELRTRLDVPLYYRRGYCTPVSQGGYAGSPLLHRVQYRFSSCDHLQVGLQAEKDPGESFRPRGWDHYGAHLALYDVGPVATAIVGDYRLSFGQGLVINSGLTMGKMLASRSMFSVRPSTGFDEDRYFHGAVISMCAREGLHVTMFESTRAHDATLTSAGDVATLVTGGYHRTQTETDKRHNMCATTVGGNVNWLKGHWQLGASGYWQHTSRTLSPGDELYRRFYPRGRDFGVAGAYYGYATRWFQLHGETAFSTEQRGVATINCATIPLPGDWTLSLSQRYYSRQYYSFHASALCDNTLVQNENGLLLRADGRLTDALELLAYADVFRNPWPRYGLTRSTNGQEVLMQPTFTLRRGCQITARYQWKHKAVAAGMLHTHRLRLAYRQAVGTAWTLTTTGQLNASERKVGFGVWQGVAWQSTGRQVLQLQSLACYFRTPTYQHRIYAYEPTVTGAFGQMALSGHGVRGALAVRCRLWHERLILEAKYGMTRYFDRSAQGSGMQAISSPWRNDLQFQAKFCW